MVDYKGYPTTKEKVRVRPVTGRTEGMLTLHLLTDASLSVCVCSRVQLCATTIHACLLGERRG